MGTALLYLLLAIALLWFVNSDMYLPVTESIAEWIIANMPGGR